MRPSTLFLLLSLSALSAATAQQFVSSGLPFDSIPKFSRNLLQVDLGVASYLLPREPRLDELCTGTNCCQADSYASPYLLVYRNHTQVQFGGRYYTSFFYTLTAQNPCSTDNDAKQCCSASADTVWVDVDPKLKVKYVSINGVPDTLNSEQNQYGLRIGNVSQQLSSLGANGLDITVAVQGYTDELCPLPASAPLPGLCEVVVQGSSPAGQDACCPLSIARASTTPFTPTLRQSFHCAADLASNAYKLGLEGVSPVFTVNGQQYITYSFRLASNPTCSSSMGCCNAQLQYAEIKVTNQAVTDVKIGSSSVPFILSPFNEPSQTSYSSLVIDNLNYMPVDLAGNGLPLTVTVRMTSNVIPDLCDSSNNEGTGACAYFLHSEDGVCCPSGLAVPSGTVPQPPVGTCTPETNVPAAEASMSLQFYERASTPTATTFTFLLANHNGAHCTKAYCADVCAWSLYINTGVVSSVVLGHDDPANNGRHRIMPAANGQPAEVAFTYGPNGESTVNFFVTLPSSARTLRDLCMPNALPGQGSKACAAIVWSRNVYVMVFFDETDIMISPPTAAPTAAPGTLASPPPPATLGQHPATCPAAVSMNNACVRAAAARYNVKGAGASPTTTFAFSADAGLLATTPGSCGKVAAIAGEKVSVRLFLNPVIVDQIVTWNKVSPSTALSLDRNIGVTWTVDQATTPFLFSLSGVLGVPDICNQNVHADQPAGTCAVEIQGSASCFRGYLAPTQDSSLPTLDQGGKIVGASADGSGSGSGVSASTVVPAVVVPVVVVLIALALAVVYYRKRKAVSHYAASIGSSDGALERPLASSSQDGAALNRDSISVPSASPSDIHIRMAASAGGAAPQ